MSDIDIKIQKKPSTQNKDENFSTDVPERPLDPTRDAADMLGDTSGLTGVTQGGPQQVGAEPDENIQDETYFRGGVIEHPTKNNPTGIPKEALSDKVYNKNTLAGMSSVTQKASEDDASEDERETGMHVKIDVDSDGYSDELHMEGNENAEDAEKDTRTSEAPYQGPENLGQQDPAGGSESAPTGEDVGEISSRYGLDYDKDDDGEGYENDELNTAEQVDEAERRLRES